MSQTASRSNPEMFMKIAKKIEVAANIALIVVCLLLGVILLKNHLLPKTTETVQAGVGPSRTPNVSSLNVDWKQSELTLVLALSTECHFCTESSPFYRQLTKERNSVRIVAVLPQEISESKKYLDDLGIKVDEVRQTSLPAIGVEGTPTLILVDMGGVVKNTWHGKLSRTQESLVLSRLAAQIGGNNVEITMGKNSNKTLHPDHP